MTYDRRYPWMAPIDRAGFRFGLDALRVRRNAGEVAKRTGTNAFYNAARDEVLFAYGDEPCGGPLAVGAEEVQRWHQGRIDDAVLYVNMGKADRREKDRIAERNARLEKRQREEKRDKELADRRPDATDYAGFLDRERRGTRKVVSCSAGVTP